MKTKLLSFAFTMLTVCALWSQDATVNGVSPQTIGGSPQTIGGRPHRFLKPVRSAATSTPPPSDTLDLRPISFPFWMVKRIALDLEEKQQLELEAELFSLEVETYQRLIQRMEQKEQDRILQLELMGKNIALLDSQLQAERRIKKGVNPAIWSLRLLGALGAGFLLGLI